jgi:hypothetical protein
MTTVELLVIITALIASVNPPTISVIGMSLASLLGKGKHPRHAAMHTASFAFGIFLSTLLISTLWHFVIVAINVNVAGYAGLILGAAVALFGLFEIKDYFWYGRGWSFKLSTKAEKKIHDWTKNHHSHWRGFLLGAYTNLKLSHYTLVLVLATTTLTAIVEPTKIYTGLLWAGAYTLPLLVVAVLIAAGAEPHSLTAWKEQSKHLMRLSIGLAYVLIGWTLLTVLSGGLKLV